MRSILIAGILALLLLSAGAVLANPAIRDGLIPELPVPGASQTFVLLSGGGWWDGIYDYDGLDPWINEGGVGSTDINVTCDVELYCYESLNASNVYFHYKGDVYAAQSAVIDGLLKSNNGQWVGIDLGSPNKSVFQLVGTTDGWGRDVTKAPGYAPINVLWELSEDAGQTWRVADRVSWGTSNTVYAMWWLLAQGLPCDHPFKFRITVTPMYHQVDGHYVMDPAVVVDPVV